MYHFSNWMITWESILNLKTEKGPQQFESLLETADVGIDDYQQEVM